MSLLVYLKKTQVILLFYVYSSRYLYENNNNYNNTTLANGLKNVFLNAFIENKNSLWRSSEIFEIGVLTAYLNA